MLSEDFGGKGHGIYTVQIHHETGELKVLHTFPSTNPAYLALSDDHTHIYALTEVHDYENPKIKAFKIQEDYSLKFINEQAIDGSLPCHIVYANKCLLIACYGSGNVLLFPLNEDGEIRPHNQNHQHQGHSINVSRQEAPHAHQVMIHPNGNDVFVPDLGIDKIKAYKLNDIVLTAISENDIAVNKGGGPRHMVFNQAGDLGYVINELTGDISIIKQTQDRFEFLKSVKSLPDTFKETPSASAIRIHPNGTHLYAANRTFDAITIFKINGEALELQSFQSTQGKTIREFNIILNGSWLIACLQDSDEVISYRIQSNGELIEHHRSNHILSPVCVTTTIHVK